jgi:hypothetical protein
MVGTVVAVLVIVAIVLVLLKVERFASSGEASGF